MPIANLWSYAIVRIIATITAVPVAHDRGVYPEGDSASLAVTNFVEANSRRNKLIKIITLLRNEGLSETSWLFMLVKYL